MTVALSNLLANAWKFTQRRGDARIEIGTADGDGEKHFWVRDNGAGFEPDLARRLFLPFQRLHSEAEFEGTGLGLAIVERVIRRHGGRIWAEGAPDQGAVFRFTL
jgi:signal transduction histidine kinase